jgi:hypothetical protein
MHNRTSFSRGLVRVAIVASAVSLLGACAPISQRAWDNGRAMTSSRAFRAAASGDMSVRTHRELMSSADARRIGYREVAYPAFGDWWW